MRSALNVTPKSIIYFLVITVFLIYAFKYGRKLMLMKENDRNSEAIHSIAIGSHISWETVFAVKNCRKITLWGSRKFMKNRFIIIKNIFLLKTSTSNSLDESASYCILYKSWNMNEFLLNYFILNLQQQSQLSINAIIFFLNKPIIVFILFLPHWFMKV